MVTCKITQYGQSTKRGGWDTYGDSYTDKFIGDHNNTLTNGTDCALTDSARKTLNAKSGDWLEIKFSNGFIYRRRVADRAPEEDMRVDFFNYYAFDKQMPEGYASVTLLT